MNKLLACTALAGVMVLSANSAQAADRSFVITVGGIVTVDGADTFNVTNATPGNTGTEVRINNDATNGADSLTISSDGTATGDTGNIGSFTVLDDNGTNQLIIHDATNGDNFRFNILGNVNGNVATNANDLRVVLFAGATNDTGDTTVAIGGNVDLGSGGFQIDSDFDETDISTLIFNGTSAQTVTGTINATEFNDFTVARNSTGYLQIGETGTNSNVTFNSAIGNVGTLERVTVVAGSTATFRNNVATESNSNALSGVLIEGTANIDTSANTVTLSDSVGDVTVNGRLNVSGTNNAELIGDSNVNINGTLVTALTGGAKLGLTTNGGLNEIGRAGGATIVAGNQIETNSGLRFGANGTGNNTLNIRKTTAFDPGATSVIDAAGDVITVEAGSTLTIGLDSETLDFGNGATITVIDSDTNAGTSYATLFGSNSIILQDTAFYDLSNNGSDAQDLIIDVALKSTIDGTVNNQNSETLRQAVLASQGAGSTAIRSALLSTTAAQTNNVAQSLQADSTGGAATTQAAASNMSAGFDLVSSHLDEQRSGKKGASSGNGTNDRSIWLRGFGAAADQDNRNGVQGYDAKTFGTMIGADKLLENNVRIGANAGYSQTKVDANGAGNQETDISSYRVGLYGGKQFNRFYVDGQLSAAYNDIEVSRFVIPAGATASADTDGYEFGARIGAGMPLAIATKQTLTPYADFQYIHANVNNYTETGAGIFNSTVNNDGINIAELQLGSKYSADITSESGTLTPSVRLAASYDFIGDTSETTQQFAGGGTAFRVQGGDVAKFGVNYGAGLSWETPNQNWIFSANYDGRSKSDYQSHGGRVEAKLKF